MARKTGKATAFKASKTARKGSGAAAAREIQRRQQGFEPLLQTTPFRILVRDIAQGVGPREELKWQGNALSALQEAAEAFLVTLLALSNLVACHANRCTIRKEDMDLVKVLKGWNEYLESEERDDE